MIMPDLSHALKLNNQPGPIADFHRRGASFRFFPSYVVT
jgi:hypothetical protein